MLVPAFLVIVLQTCFSLHWHAHSLCFTCLFLTVSLRGFGLLLLLFEGVVPSGDFGVLWSFLFASFSTTLSYSQYQL